MIQFQIVAVYKALLRRLPADTTALLSLLYQVRITNNDGSQAHVPSPSKLLNPASS